MLDERQLPGPQGRLLFAYLVTKHGTPVPRDELVEVLWEGVPPASWDKALRVLVSKLRKVVAENAGEATADLTASFGCYRLDLPAETWVDVLAAESAAQFDADLGIQRAEGLVEQ